MADEPGIKPPRSRLTDIAEQTVISTGSTAAAEVPAVPVRAPANRTPAQPEARPVVESDPVTESEPVTEDGTAEVQARRRRFLAQLGEFRRSQVLVPVAAAPGAGGADAPLTVEWGGVRWILAFTAEAALARFAVARGEGQRAWRYRGVWGAAVLDAAVPTVAASGVPCGVVVNAGDGERGWCCRRWPRSCRSRSRWTDRSPSVPRPAARAGRRVGNGTSRHGRRRRCGAGQRS